MSAIVPSPAPDAQPSPRRIKIACINWSFSDAPHALVYVLRNDEMSEERYFDKWADAVMWADALRARFARLRGGVA